MPEAKSFPGELAVACRLLITYHYQHSTLSHCYNYEPIPTPYKSPQTPTKANPKKHGQSLMSRYNLKRDAQDTDS
jgi:hypothetical protein